MPGLTETVLSRSSKSTSRAWPHPIPKRRDPGRCGTAEGNKLIMLWGGRGDHLFLWNKLKLKLKLSVTNSVRRLRASSLMRKNKHKHDWKTTMTSKAESRKMLRPSWLKTAVRSDS